MKAQFFLVVCALYFSAAADFPSLDFAASAPLTFSHKIGGGAWNTGANGRDLDTVESLEGGDWACGDYVTHLIQVPTAAYTHPGPVSLTLTYAFTSDSTGQSGVGYGDFGKVQLNTGNVTNGGRTVPINGPPFVYGLDSYVKPNPGTGTTLTVIKKWLDKGMFISNGNLWITIRVDGLQPSQQTIVRMDVRIFCLPGTRPTGNLQGTLQTAYQNYTDAGKQVGEVVNGGVQTVPLKNVGSIIGIAPCTPSNVTGINFNATVYITDPNMGTGGTTANFYYSWKQGGFAIIGTSINYTEIHTFDEQCSPNQAGELQYNRGACGCELTSIVTDQPRFFFTPDDTYYTIPGTNVVVNGVTYVQYTAKVAGPVQYLLYFPNETIFRAYLTDGRVMTFVNVVYGANTIPASAFTLATSAPTTCLCNRVIDVALLMDRNFYVSPTAFVQAQVFAANVAAQFTIGPSNVLIGTSYYDDAYYPVQTIANGNTLTNIQNAIKSIQCVKGSSGCGILNANVDVASYIRRATDDLLASPRASTASKAILLVTTGWASTSDAVKQAVLDANKVGVNVFAGVYNNIMLLSEITAALAPVEPRYVVNEFTSSSMTSAAGLPYLLQLSGVVCLASQTPCGSSCCGACDTTCGKCLPVTSCPTASNNCTSFTQIIGGCCVDTLKPGCPDIGNCMVGKCDNVTGQCSYSSGCVPPNGSCAVGTCVNNSCKFTDPAKTEFCRKQVCINGSLQWQPINNSCPPNGCSIFVCNNTAGACDSTPLPNPYTLTPCETNQCVNGNWTVPTTKTCPSADLCKAGTCNPTTGVCEFSAKCPTNPSNLCDLNRCNATTGACYQAVDTCAAQSTLCSVATCVPATGACSIVNTVCGLHNNSCNNTVCDVADGKCKPVATTGCGPCDCTPFAAFKCIRGTCVRGNGNQYSCVTSPINCSATLPDSCHVASCTNASGCVYTLRNCSQEVTLGPCEELVVDPNAATCCSKKPKVCTGTDLCLNYGCNSTTSQCTSQYKCNPGNKCFFETCTPTGCQPTTANCPSDPDLCLLPKCDNATGCLLTKKSCDDGDGCTDDFCNSTTGDCYHTAKVCDDGRKCTNDTCVAGECVFNAFVCDDKISCTTDYPCDEATGTCPTPTPVDQACVDVQNPCKTWKCDVTAGRCVSTNVTCNLPGTDNCTGQICIDFQGCTLVPKVCVLNYTKNPTDCTTISCQLSTGNCITVSQRCAAIDVATVVGATLTTAAVVGIIIAIIACVGLSGGTTYAIVNRMGDGALASTQNNPLFVAKGADKINPLYAHST